MKEISSGAKVIYPFQRRVPTLGAWQPGKILMRLP